MTDLQRDENTPFRIQVRMEQIGRDCLFIVTGGEAHIGAVATAYPEGEGTAVLLSVVPGHREDQLAREMAKQACIRLGCTVTVAAGIHIDQPTKEEIRLAVETAHKEMDKKLNQLTSKTATETQEYK